MDLGKNLSRINDYGITQTKGGSLQIFINFNVAGESSTWYGMPYKKDGEVNDICLMQLATCGFDPAANTFEHLALGLASGILITDEDVDVYVADVVQPDGSLRRRINSIGEFGPKRVSASDTTALTTAEQKEKLKAAAGKFKVRQKKEKQDPDEALPF